MRPTTALTGLMAIALSLLPATMAQANADAAKPSPTCTSVVHLPGGCCPPVTAHTTTASVDCHGCALITNYGPICDIVSLHLSPPHEHH